MPLTKLVNGVRIELTPEEESKVREEWDRNLLKMEQERIKVKEEKNLKQALKNSVASKLKTSANFTDEEVDFLIPQNFSTESS